ncbi:MAG: ribonuclease III [Solirubrobacterales bacterium]|nr:ribonuclease III [Solirubrobacterales bacterium]
MTREEVFSLIQAHLADELDVDPARIDDGTRFKEDLEADSLDLYTLVQELEDSYGVKMSDQVFTHASWTARRSDSYTRLAFLGDSVLGLAITAHLYPRLEAERYGAGRLTKIRAQTVSGPSCRAVAERLGVPDELRAAAPEGAEHATALVETERVLASITEAIIGACFLHAGYERTAAAVVEAFQPELEHALENPVDYKSTLQERLAQRGDVVAYEVTAEKGPPHDRTFEVTATVGGEAVGTGAGRSKKHAEQEAARVALEGLDGDA